MSYPPPARLDTELRTSPGHLRGYLIDKKYFVRNPFVMNILQTQTHCKPLKASILRPKYPKPGGGGTPQLEREKEAETHRAQQEEL
jgi:hypothetical protein